MIEAIKAHFLGAKWALLLVLALAVAGWGARKVYIIRQLEAELRDLQAENLTLKMDLAQARRNNDVLQTALDDQNADIAHWKAVGLKAEHRAQVAAAQVQAVEALMGQHISRIALSDPPPEASGALDWVFNEAKAVLKGVQP